MNTPTSPTTPFGDHTNVTEETTLQISQEDGFLTCSPLTIMPTELLLWQHPMQIPTPPVSWVALELDEPTTY